MGFVFEEGEGVHTGAPVDNDFVHVEGELVSDGDISKLAFVEDRGIGAGLLDVTFYFKTDNFHAMWVNNEQVWDRTDGGSGAWTTVYDFSAQLLRGGENVVATEVYNSDGDDGPYTSFDENDSTGALSAFSAEDANGDVVVASGRTAATSYVVYDYGVQNLSRQGPPPDDSNGNPWYHRDYDDSGWDSPGQFAGTQSDLPGDPYKYWNTDGGHLSTLHVHETYQRFTFEL